MTTTRRHKPAIFLLVIGVITLSSMRLLAKSDSDVDPLILARNLVMLAQQNIDDAEIRSKELNAEFKKRSDFLFTKIQSNKFHIVNFIIYNSTCEEAQKTEHGNIKMQKGDTLSAQEANLFCDKNSGLTQWNYKKVCESILKSTKASKEQKAPVDFCASELKELRAIDHESTNLNFSSNQRNADLARAQKMLAEAEKKAASKTATTSPKAPANDTSGSQE